MDKITKELFELTLSSTKSKILASSDTGISVELIEFLGELEYRNIIKISDVLTESYGQNARFTRNTIKKYFNYPKTLPYVIRFQDEIQGFVVGVPLEYFEKESWVQCDENLTMNNTIYTYAFLVKKERRDFGISKMLKRIYQNSLKRRGYKYVTGHVREGVTNQFIKKSKIIKKIANWNNTGYVFEYYRTEL